MKSSICVTNRKRTASFRVAGLMLAIAPLLLMLSAADTSAHAQTSGAPSPSDWTEFHRDNMQRWNPYETVLGVNNVGSLQPKWKSPIGSITQSSPAVVNGVLYVGTDEGSIYALNSSTGVLLWNIINTGVNSSPAVVNGVVYFGSVDGNVYALNASTGAKLWSYATGNEVVSSPAVANGVVYVGSEDGNVYALNANTGAELWKYGIAYQGTSSPAVVNGVVYAGSDDGVSVFALRGADLYLRIRPTPTTVQQGDLLMYAFVVWNLGPDEAVHEVLTTQVPNGTTFDNIQISGTPGLGTCTTPPYGGTGEIICHENSSMAPNTTWTVSLTVKVTAPSGTIITESATATEETFDPDTANSTATVPILISPEQQGPIACWGDSLTQGNQDRTGVSYPGVLQQLLGIPVYNGGVDGQTSTQIAARMLAATNMYGDTDVFWAGRNNYKQPLPSDPEPQILSDIASMVNALTSSPKKLLVLSVPNGDGIWDLKGTQDYNRIMALNSALAAAYPNNYLDIRSYLVSQYDPTNLLDLFDHENDVWPASLRVHNLTGSLAAPVGDSDTTIYMNVTSAVRPIISNILEVDSEYMCITEVTAPTSPGAVYALKVLRGYANSPVSSHQANLAIVGTDPLHLNANGYTKVAQQVANWLNWHYR
jgi:lysophospholipase L1-like esterase